MRVVLGGVASRHDIPIDRLDDLQLAIETLLAEEPSDGHDFVLSLSADGRGFCVRLEGLTNDALRRALISSGPFEPCEGCPLDIRLFLDALVDEYVVIEEAEAHFAVEMQSRLRR
jgi:hypothetical protein